MPVQMNRHALHLTPMEKNKVGRALAIFFEGGPYSGDKSEDSTGTCYSTQALDLCDKYVWTRPGIADAVKLGFTRIVEGSEFDTNMFMGRMKELKEAGAIMCVEKACEHMTTAQCDERSDCKWTDYGCQSDLPVPTPAPTSLKNACKDMLNQEECPHHCLWAFGKCQDCNDRRDKICNRTNIMNACNKRGTTGDHARKHCPKTCGLCQARDGRQLTSGFMLV